MVRRMRSTRRRALRQLGGMAAALSVYSPWRHLHASGRARPLRIGITADVTGLYTDSGADDKRGIELAVAAANARGGALGRTIETLHADTGSDPERAASIAAHLIRDRGVGFLIGAVHSGVAAELSQVAQRYGVIYMNTNSSSPSESGKNCHRTKFVWDGNGTNFARAMVRNAMRWVGNQWLLMTHDYDWGHGTSMATRKLVTEAGGQIVDELIVPQGTRDFTDYLLKIRRIAPNVVAAAVGGDDMKALQAQVQSAGTDRNPAWLNNQQDWPDVWMRNGKGLFGIFATTWYHKLDLPGVGEFVAAYKKAFPAAPVPVPGNVSYNGFMATRELLRAIERTGTTNNLKLIRALERLRIPAADRMQHHDAYMDPRTHQMQQTVYMATANLRPADPTDLYKILARISPEECADPAAVTACALESYESTPSFDA
jgi:branched-chain amino acid transport system substrate-binding protein